MRDGPGLQMPAFPWAAGCRAELFSLLGRHGPVAPPGSLYLVLSGQEAVLSLLAAADQEGDSYELALGQGRPASGA